jgi:hypothetical protein
MATSPDEYKPYYGTRFGPFVAGLRTVEGIINGFIESIIKRIAAIFMLTDEEQMQAGIYLGGEGRED